MKKAFILSCCIMLLVCNFAIAQKNTWMIYGGGTYDRMNYTPNYGNTSNYYTPFPLYLTTWSVNPGVGYMVGNHLMIGLQGGFGKQENITQGGFTTYSVYSGTTTVPIFNDFKETVTSWQAGAFCRYTSPLGKRFFVYTQLFAGKFGEEYEQDIISNVVAPYSYSSPATPEGNGFLIHLFPGVGMNAYHGYGVNLSVAGITYTSYNAISATNLNHFNITLGQFSFGIHKVIGWSKLKSTPPPAGAVGEKS